MAVYSQSKKILFVHVPKAGGTSIQHWLLANTDSQNLKNSKHFPYERIMSQHSISVDFSFAVVRNPWHYCVSWYFFKRDRALRRIVREDKSKGKWSAEYNKQVLEDFGKGIHYFISNMVPNERHLQFDRVQGVDCVMQLETLSRDFKHVQQKFNCFKPLPTLNVADRDREYRSYYTNETRELVANKFRKDIEYFGYSF